MAERPGVMVYFEKWEPMLRLSDTEIGTLFRAMLLYGKHGEVPELPGILGLLWDMIRPIVDRDGIRYQKGVDQRRYAVYCREEKKHNREPMPEEDWMELYGYRAISSDNEQYPISTPSTASTPPSASTPSSSSKTAAKGGDGGEGRAKVILTIDAPHALPVEEFESKREAALSMLENYGGS